MDGKSTRNFVSETHPRQLRKLKLFSKWFNAIKLGQGGLIIHLNRRWLGVRTSIAHKGPLRKPGDVNQDPMWNRVKCYYRSHAGWSMSSQKTDTELRSCGKDSKAQQKGQECCSRNDLGGHGQLEYLETTRLEPPLKVSSRTGEIHTYRSQSRPAREVHT